MSGTPSNTSGKPALFVQWFVHLAIVWLCAGTQVPGVNESHYMTKAKHAFDSQFAPGDLFLESHNSHLASTYLAGVLTSALSLPAATWVGRFLAWGFLAAAWIRFCRSLHIAWLVSGLALASWIYAVQYGHWAGEWAVGGFEGKALAYPCVIISLACGLESKWRWTWIWLGLAVLWHPLVGGWSGLTVGAVWLLSKDAPKWKQIPWLLAAAAIASVGILPALSGLDGRASEGNIVASQIHVYYRLSHHLCAQTFSETRHFAAIGTLSIFVAVNATWLVFRKTIQRRTRRQAESAPGALNTIDHSVPTQHKQVSLGDHDINTRTPISATTASGRLLCVAWFSILIALCGLAIDLTLSRTEHAELASKLLRFYWFRWADIAVPLAWTATSWQLLSYWGGLSPLVQGSLTGLTNAKSVTSFSTRLGRGILVLACVLTISFIGLKAYRGWDSNIPPADRLVVYNPGQLRSIQWDGVESNRLRDWQAVCLWIRENTPTDSLWLTPKHQQSFKWYAHRAEVVCWKDVPQDNTSLIEWYKRIVTLEPPRTPSGKQRGWNDDELRLLSKTFQFEYVLIDRTYYSPQTLPPRFELLYPHNIDNRSFAVFRIRHPSADGNASGSAEN